MTIRKITKAANALQITLENPGRGRAGFDKQKRVMKRNLLMLAVYELGRRGEGAGNNYGGAITYNDLQGLFNIGGHSVSLGLKRARAIDPKELDSIKSLLV